MMLRQLRILLIKPPLINHFEEFICAKAFATKKTFYKKRANPNPGVERRARILTERDEERMEDVEEIDSLESDFMSAGTTHREYVREMAQFKELEKFRIVKRKYFDERRPNFLSWNDKKQIQYLHKTNPKEWTVEKLSTGFPALPDVIKKIIKADWTKDNQTKIAKHDDSVKRNWEQFKKGKFNLPPDLTEHLSKFTERKEQVVTVNFDLIEKRAEEVPSGEFSDIIRSYKGVKNEGTRQEKDTTVRKPKKDTYLLSKDIDTSSHTTLSLLKTTLVNEGNFGKELDEDDKMLIATTQSKPKQLIENSDTEHAIINLDDIAKTAYLTSTNSKSDEPKHLTYPERIIIPKDKLKKGFTYKLNDCYYGSDGLFLYRVPGMEK